MSTTTTRTSPPTEAVMAARLLRDLAFVQLETARTTLAATTEAYYEACNAVRRAQDARG